MRTGTKPQSKQLNPIVSVVIIVVVVMLAVVAGYVYLRPKPAQGSGAPEMSAEVKKQRQQQSSAWGEELRRAKKEGRLPDYSKLPSAGHPGFGGGPTGAAPAGK